jgi:hypothetical protein
MWLINIINVCSGTLPQFHMGFCHGINVDGQVFTFAGGQYDHYLILSLDMDFSISNEMKRIHFIIQLFFTFNRI